MEITKCTASEIKELWYEVLIMESLDELES